MNETVSQSKHQTANANLLTSGILQRKCAACDQQTVAGGECTECSKNQLSLQRAPGKPALEPTRSFELPPIVLDVLRSPGQPLDAATRSFMEPRFGHDFCGVRTRSSTTPHIPARLAVGAPHDHFEQEADLVADQVTRMATPATATRYDFSNVRIHADALASESARQINAQAYTVGNHIVFDRSEYAPHSDTGQKLLAHELAHVVQQNGNIARGDRAQGNLIQGHSTSPRLQGKWRLDRIKLDDKVEVNYTDGHGWATSAAAGFGVYGRAYTQQETGFIHQKEGGEAQVAHWVRGHYIFKNDGADGDFLQLNPTGEYSGNAKAEDLQYARAGAVVAGAVTERTTANPTPPSKVLFHMEGGGVSTATVGEWGTIEAEIPVGERGSVNITIPLTKVEEGEFIPFSDSKVIPPHDVASTVDEVDVWLAARVKADAEIRTKTFGLAPWISRNRNISWATSAFNLAWESRPAPGTGSLRGTSTVPGGQGQTAGKPSPGEKVSGDVGGQAGITGVTYACAICKCGGDKECGGGRIHTIWMGQTECNRQNKKEAQRLCNHDPTFLAICDLDQNRPDGKKCSVHHHDFACSDKETEKKCTNRRQ